MLKVERSKSVACVRVQRCQKKKSVFSGTLSFIGNKCAEIWNVEPTSKVLLWTLTLSSDLPKSLSGAVRWAQTNCQTMETSKKNLPPPLNPISALFIPLTFGSICCYWCEAIQKGSIMIWCIFQKPRFAAIFSHLNHTSTHCKVSLGSWFLICL